MGIWACYLPSIQDKLDIDDSSLGLAVLLMYFGTVSATHLAAILTKRFGSRNSTTCGALGFSACLPMIALAPNFEVLCVVMFLYGYFMGLMDGKWSDNFPFVKFQILFSLLLHYFIIHHSSFDEWNCSINRNGGRKALVEQHSWVLFPRCRHRDRHGWIAIFCGLVVTASLLCCSSCYGGLQLCCISRSL